jgi:excisionase family DNA binding protein
MMYSTQEVASKLGISRRRVQELIKEGVIEARKIGRDWVVTEYSRAQGRRKRGRPRKQRKGDNLQ